MYVQESGRAGRDNLPSTAYLLYGNTGKLVETEVKGYALNSATCHQRVLFKNLFEHKYFSIEVDFIVGKWSKANLRVTP